MVQKSYAFLGILAVLLMSLGFVSAYTSTQDGIKVNVIQELPNPVTPGSTHDIQINITNNNGTTIDLSWVDTTDSSGITTAVPTNSSLTNGNSAIYTLTYSIPSGFNGTVNHKVDLSVFVGSTNIANFHPYSTANYTNISTTLIYGCTDSDANNYDPNATTDDGSCTYTIADGYKYCDDFDGEKGDLEITSFEINNNGKGDDNEWEYLDEIEIEVTVENTGDDNIDDVIVEIMIKDDDGNTITRRKMGLDEDEFDLGRIKDGDEEVAIFKIDELPIDLDEGTYRIYVRAYDEKDEDSNCVSVSEDFNDDDETYFEFDVTSSDGATVIVKDDSEVILASCGDKNVEVRFMVYNIGDDDEEKVLVTLEDSKLGIYEKVVIDNLRDKKGKEVVFFITIPEGLDKSYYELDIYTYYDYDEDEDELDEVVAYGESSEEEGDDFSIGLEILSCKGPVPSITASLDSEAKVGEELVITASVTNNGDDNNFVVSVTEFEDWAELVSVEPASLLINEDGVATITIKLVPTKGGFQTLKVNAIVDGEVSNQAVSVNIEEKEGLFANVSDTLLYSISGVVALLILIFLVLIVRVSRKSRKPEF